MSRSMLPFQHCMFPDVGLGNISPVRPRSSTGHSGSDPCWVGRNKTGSPRPVFSYLLILDLGMDPKNPRAEKSSPSFTLHCQKISWGLRSKPGVALDQQRQPTCGWTPLQTQANPHPPPPTNLEQIIADWGCSVACGEDPAGRVQK